MGARLLERTSRQVALTEAGKVLYREAQALLRQAEDVRVLVRRVDAGLRGRLRIGFVGSMLYRPAGAVGGHAGRAAGGGARAGRAEFP